MGTLKRVLAFLVVLACAAGCRAGTIPIELPELLGDYECGLEMLGAWRSASVQTTFPLDGVAKARLIVTGTVAPGRVRGDGVTRQAIEAVLDGGFAPRLVAGDNVFITPADATNGAFRFERDYLGPFYSVPPMPFGARFFDAEVDVGLGPSPLPLDLVPWIGEPPSGDPKLHFFDGLELVTPMTGTITEAILILEGVPVPEPATLALLAAGAAAFRVRRRKAR
ncbi:MAG: PEP-CTERM sorting domain-containing protein [Phycisphaerae bacterium]